MSLSDDEIVYVSPQQNRAVALDTLTQALNLVGGDRAKQHGCLVESHSNVATLWSAYLGVPVTTHQAAVMMALLKVARTKAGAHNPDDYIDLAGYAAIAAQIADIENSA